MHTSATNGTSDTPQLLELSEAGGPAGAALKPRSPLLDIVTQVQVCVGETKMSVAELGGARTGQVLTLDRAVDAPVDLLLAGQVVARGVLVAVGEHFGVRLTEVPEPLTVSV